MPDVNTTAASTAAPETNDIASDVRAAFEKHTEAPVAAESGTTPTPRVEASVDAKTAPDTKPTEASADTPVVAAPPETTEVPAEVKARLDRIPVGWKGGAANWHALPVEAKQYIVDRNAGVDRELAQRAPAVGFYEAMSSVFRPHEGFLRAQGANPVQATQYLLDGYVTLMTGTPQQRQQVIRNLAQQAGLDLASVQGEAPQADPELEALRREIVQLRQNQQQQVQSAQSAEQQTLHAQIEAFKAQPGHEHFEKVQKHMASLLMSGAAQSLNDAYDTACWANPEVRASLMAQRDAQAAEKRKKEAEDAKRAAVSVPGAPAAPGGQNLGDMDLRQSLEHQFRVAGRV